MAHVTRHPRLTRTRIVGVALGLLSEFGLGDLTMRRIAERLDAQPSAIYWHFANKQDLLTACAEHIVAQVLPQLPVSGSSLNLGTATEADLSQVIHRWAQQLREGLLRYRDSAEVVTLAMANSADFQPIVQLRLLLTEAGLADRQLTAATTALLHFVLGETAYRQAQQLLDREQQLADDQFTDAIGLLVSGIHQQISSSNVKQRVG